MDDDKSPLIITPGPSPSQIHKKDQHYRPLDHKKGGKGAGSKDMTQGGNGEEYSALGNSKVKKNPTNDNVIVHHVIHAGEW